MPIPKPYCEIYYNINLTIVTSYSDMYPIAALRMSQPIEATAPCWLAKTNRARQAEGCSASGRGLLSRFNQKGRRAMDKQA